MSHFTQVKTQIRDRRILEKALAKLGYEVVSGEQGQQVRGFMGDIQNAEFKVSTGSKYDIGFEKDVEGNYSLVADWELMPRVAGITQEEFQASVKREYARETILQTAAEQGYEVQMEEHDGTIEMVVVQW